MILSFIKGSFNIKTVPEKVIPPAEMKNTDDKHLLQPGNSGIGSTEPADSGEESFEVKYNKLKEQVEIQRFERELIAGSKKGYD